MHVLPPHALLVLIFIALFASVAFAKEQPHLRRGTLHRHNDDGTNATMAAWRFPLHQHSGTIHVYIWIGQPAVRQTLIVDTGSRFTATACEGCRDCGVHANAYLPSSSTTRIQHVCDDLAAGGGQQQRREQGALVSLGCRMADQCFRNTCQIAQRYTEGSTWKAVEVNDIVAFGEEHLYESTWDTATAYSFGCQTEVRGLFRKQYADGILGLERTDYSLVQTMVNQGILKRPSFSLCLNPSGGWLALGGAQTDWHEDDAVMQFTPIPAYTEHAWHSVMVREIWLGSHVLVADEPTAPEVWQALSRGKRTILDSGTTDTFLPAALEPHMASAWEQVTGFVWKQRKRDYTYEEFQSLPLVILVLEGNVTLSLQPKYYMEGTPTEPWTGRRRLTNRVYTDERVGAVLGLNAMMGYDFYFEKSRIGIAKADCR